MDGLPLVEIQDLCLEFSTYDGVSKVLDGVNLRLEAGSAVGLVGETGSGKTLTALSIMGLLPRPSAIVTNGEVRVAGRDVLRMGDQELRSIRGREIGMVFQDPTAALNPAFTISEQLTDVLLEHSRRRGGTERWRPLGSRAMKREASRRATELLTEVGIGEPLRILKSYPHELSVGQRQRVVIAIGLSGDPRLVIADEPTTSVDVRVEAQILRLLKRLVAERGLSILLITHNLTVVTRLCEFVAVMYAGTVVEYGRVQQVLSDPKHPYTRGLVASVPTRETSKVGRLGVIGGSVPDFLSPPLGCRFHPRCPAAMPVCAVTKPPITVLPGSRTVSCHLYGQTDG